MEINTTNCIQSGDRIRVDGLAREDAESAWVPFSFDLTEAIRAAITPEPKATDDEN